MSLQVDIKNSAELKIVDCAKRIIDGSLGLVLGCREINSLRLRTDRSQDKVFDGIISFVSETDDIPLGEGVRRNFGDEYLKEKDKRAREISKSARGELDAACMKIINEFSKK